MKELFARFSTGCARFSGQPPMQLICITLAMIGVVAYFTGNDHFLNGANLIISIVTLLLLPLLQASQNRDGAAMQAKLDELIKVNEEARNALIGLEIEARKTSSECAAMKKDAVAIVSLCRNRLPGLRYYQSQVQTTHEGAVN